MYPTKIGKTFWDSKYTLRSMAGTTIQTLSVSVPASMYRLVCLWQTPSWAEFESLNREKHLWDGQFCFMCSYRPIWWQLTDNTRLLDVVILRWWTRICIK